MTNHKKTLKIYDARAHLLARRLIKESKKPRLANMIFQILQKFRKISRHRDR